MAIVTILSWQVDDKKNNLNGIILALRILKYWARWLAGVIENNNRRFDNGIQVI